MELLMSETHDSCSWCWLIDEEGGKQICTAQLFATD